MEERTTYLELKQWFLNDAFLWCQRKFEDGKINKWIGNETEWGGALYSFESSFEMPVENLMLYTLSVITDAGRDKIFHEHLMRKIDVILEGNDLNELIKDLGEEERKDFLYDLNLVLNNREME